MHDHRKLGRELGLFATDPLIGAGLPYWLPAGAAVRHALEEYLRELERRAGYQHVYSPVLGKRELYEMSGQWSHYRDGMYPPMELGGEQVVLRPSLCPHHALLYRSRGRSYRELPLRLAELGGQYRAELSGVLGGLTRVRAMQLNDAHIFCPPDQAAGEARAALAMIRQAYAALGIEPARYRLSLPGPGGKYVGDPDIWDQAADMLAGILDWLAPEQLVVLPVTDAQGAAAAGVARQAAGFGLRAHVAGPESGTLNRRIRSSRLVPYQAVVGEREAGAGQVAIRLRDGRRLPPLPADAALAGIAAHVGAHRTSLWDAAAPGG